MNSSILHNNQYISHKKVDSSIDRKGITILQFSINSYLKSVVGFYDDLNQLIIRGLVKRGMLFQFSVFSQKFSITDTNALLLQFSITHHKFSIK